MENIAQHIGEKFIFIFEYNLIYCLTECIIQ